MLILFSEISLNLYMCILRFKIMEILLINHGFIINVPFLFVNTFVRNLTFLLIMQVAYANIISRKPRKEDINNDFV